MNERTPLSLPITLEVGGSAENNLRAAVALIDVATIYSNSIFNLVRLACAQTLAEDVTDVDELLNDIQNACVIGTAINISIGESLVPLSAMIPENEMNQ